MQEVNCKMSSLKPLKPTRVNSRHNRSKSDSHRRVEQDGLEVFPYSLDHLKLDAGELEGMGEHKNQIPTTKLESSLKQEILQLEKRLQEQFAVRMALEKALGYRFSSHDTFSENAMLKPARELIKEIAVLELEVVYLEQHLLLLYRKAFEQQISAVSPAVKNGKLKSSPLTQTGKPVEVVGDAKLRKEQTVIDACRLQVPQGSLVNLQKESNPSGVTERLLDSGIHRTDSSLSQRSAYFSSRTSPPMKNLDKDARLYYSQPLSFIENSDVSPSVTSLAEHLGTCIADHVPETPNGISEDMIKCMSSIYCKISDPPLMQHRNSYSPMSSLSSMSAFSPEEQCDVWSAQCRKDSSFDVRLENPFHVEGLKDFSGPYSMMVEIPWICRERHRLDEIDDMLQTYKSLVCRLRDVDPRRMKHDEKLAFWINIHNALVMHAFLVYGIPQSNAKRTSLILKAAYNVGGQSISTDMIQTSILGCRMPRPGQWIWTFFSSRSKFRSGDGRQAYSLSHPEPLLHFALCSGSHSDPAVRAYTPKRVHKELEVAKEEYIRATVGARNDQKLLLPKILDLYARDLGLSPFRVVEMIQHYMPKTTRETLQRYLHGKSRKSVEWMPHNFAFRYLLSGEMLK